MYDKNIGIYIILSESFFLCKDHGDYQHLAHLDHLASSNPGPLGYESPSYD